MATPIGQHGRNVSKNHLFDAIENGQGESTDPSRQVNGSGSQMPLAASERGPLKSHSGDNLLTAVAASTSALGAGSAAAVANKWSQSQHFTTSASPALPDPSGPAAPLKKVDAAVKAGAGNSSQTISDFEVFQVLQEAAQKNQILSSILKRGANKSLITAKQQSAEAQIQQVKGEQISAVSHLVGGILQAGAQMGGGYVGSRWKSGYGDNERAGLEGPAKQTRNARERNEAELDTQRSLIEKQGSHEGKHNKSKREDLTKAEASREKAIVEDGEKDPDRPDTVERDTRKAAHSETVNQNQTVFGPVSSKVETMAQSAHPLPSHANNFPGAAPSGGSNRVEASGVRARQKGLSPETEPTVQRKGMSRSAAEAGFAADHSSKAGKEPQSKLSHQLDTKSHSSINSEPLEESIGGADSESLRKAKDRSKKAARGDSLTQSAQGLGQAVGSFIDLFDKFAGGGQVADQAKISGKEADVASAIAQSNVDAAKTGVDQASDSWKDAIQAVQSYCQRHADAMNRIGQ